MSVTGRLAAQLIDSDWWQLLAAKKTD